MHNQLKYISTGNILKMKYLLGKKKNLIFVFLSHLKLKFNTYTFQSNDKLLCQRECFNVPRRYEMI